MHVVVLDDHPIVAGGIVALVRNMPDISGVSCGAPATGAPSGHTLYIVDLEMGPDSGFDVIQRLLDTPGTHILVYTMHDEPWIKARLRQYPIDGAVAKSEPISMLRDAVESILHGRRYFSPVFHTDADEAVSLTPKSDISGREREVLRLLCCGLTSEQIATQLCVSVNTVKTYRRRLLDKFNVGNVAELIYQAKGFI